MDDITLAAEILRWLPAKSVLRFRSVSKQWASFCSEPYFAKLRRQNLDGKLIQNRGRLYSLDQDSLDCALEVDNLLQDLYLHEDSDGLHRAREFDDRFENSDFGLKHVLGCSDGMLCMSVHEYNRDPMEEVHGAVVPVKSIPPADLNRDIIVICDLSTGARRVVPPSPVEGLGDIPTRRVEVTTLARPAGSKCPADWGRPFRSREDSPTPTMPASMWRYFTYGFGFDPSAEDYKLVRISQYIFRPATLPYYNDVLLSEVKVYSVKTDSWSRVDQDIAHICINDRTEPAIADGVLYWIAGASCVHGLKSCRQVVVAFDLADESFLDIVYEEERSNVICLGSMGGKLCVMTNYGMIVKLWKIEKHGDAWILLGSFRASVPCFVYTTMHFSKNVDKVLVVQQEFRHCRDKICFDLAKETWSTLPMKFISMEGKVDMV